MKGNRERKITIDDIAKKLNVSKTLVSFVLNGKAEEKRISEQMAKKVLDTAQELNYKPSYFAKSLRTGRSFTIGLVVADISNPFFARMARFIEIETEKSNYNLIFVSSDEDKDKFHKQVMTLQQRNVDGFVLTTPIGSEKTIESLIRSRTPIVLVDRFMDGFDVSSVTINNYKAAYDATCKLISSNRKRISFFNVNDELNTMHQRTLGYRAALQDNGIVWDNNIEKQLEFSHKQSLVQVAIEDVIDKGIDAVLFSTNKLGVFGVESLQNMNIQMPKDVSIISFDDTEAYRVSSPSITALKQPLEQMCKKAVDILLKKIDLQEPENQQYKFTAEIILRNSCI